MSKSLLVFATLLLAASMCFAATASSNPQQPSPVLQAQNVPADGFSQPVQQSRWRNDTAFNLAEDDPVCYRIRAYIFKRDDDHAPEFVRSTTCGPKAPHAKDARWPDAKLVPAN